MIKLERLKPFLLKPDLVPNKVAGHLVEFKNTYTLNRIGLDKKRWSDAAVSSYASFYLPTNYAKLEMLLQQLPRELVNEIHECDVIDFGCGPGTYGLAFLDYFEGDFKNNLWSIDHDEKMITQAKSILCGLYENLKKQLQFSDSVTKTHLGQKRCLIFGNSLNENTHSDVLKVIRKINPDYLIFIEPGTPAVFDEIVLVRDFLGKNDYQCFFPCPSISLNCPMAKRVSEGEQDWCHQVWRGVHDPAVEQLGQLAKIDRKAMAFIGHVYAKSNIRVETKARFVRFISESKHAFHWQVCIEEAGELTLKNFEISKRNLKKFEMKELKKMSVGENFNYEVVKTLGDGSIRVELKK